MILIISQDYGEYSTDKVIDWITFNKVKFKRLNGVDFFKSIYISIGNKGVEIKSKSFDWNEFGSIWFRRWLTYENTKDAFLGDYKNIETNKLSKKLNRFLSSELKELTAFFFDWIPKNKSFDKITDQEVNKLIVLRKAVELGLDIPNTIIVNGKSIFEVTKKNFTFITKPISNGIGIQVDGETYSSYTSLVDETSFNKLSKIIPSLLQKEIEKKYEIRTFYLEGKCYSMAIFSQNDEQTKVDFRRYNFDEPNRTVPFKLPVKVENKLHKLAVFFELNACSFDLIKTIDNKYIFLEVNPGGQFGMVSYPCNFYLEKKIALALIKLNSENNEC